MQTPADHSFGDTSPQFLAGSTAPAGVYRLVGTSREVRLDRDDILPATLDGHIAVYERRPATWAEVQGRTERA